MAALRASVAKLLELLTGAWLAGTYRVLNLALGRRSAPGLDARGHRPKTEIPFDFPHDRLLPPPPHFAPDALTRSAIADVERHFPAHPGSTDRFGWPVTTEQAHAALDDFIAHRLPEFGRWQDAMWSGQPFLWHSLLSTALNLKLLDPRAVIAATVTAYESGRVPLAAAEGFIRQILGWREFVRGVYGRQMPALAEANQYGHSTPLPTWY